MDNHSRGDNPSSQHKNESIRYLSRISTCFQKEGVGIFCDNNNNFSFCSLSKHNYAPVEIPLFKVSKPIQKEYTLDEVALIIGKQDPCFLWVSLIQGITTSCLEKLLSKSTLLRQHLNARIDHSSCANYLLRIKTALKASHRLDMRIIHEMWYGVYSKPLVYLALDDRHLMSVLLKYGADPHTSFCYTESQLQKMIPEFYGEQPNKLIYLFREHYAQLSSRKQLQRNHSDYAEQTYCKEEKLSTLCLPWLSLTTSKNTSFHINVYCDSGQLHRVEKTLSSDEAITVIDSQGTSTCMTISNLLDSFSSQEPSYTYTTVTYQDGYLTIIPPFPCTIPTQELPLKEGTDIPNPAQFSVSIPFSPEHSGTITSLTTRTNSLKSPYDIALFLLYGPGAINGLNLIQQTNNQDVEELLLKNGADLFHNPSQNSFDLGLIKLLCSNTNKRERLISQHLQSPNLGVCAHEFIVTLFFLKAYKSARTLLLHVSSGFDFDLLCESYLSELCTIVFTEASDLFDFGQMRNLAYSKATSASGNDCPINTVKETVSASIVQKFLIQSPELISAIFNHSDKIEQFYETITTLAKNAIYCDLRQLTVFLLDNQTDVVLKCITDCENLRDKLISIAQSCSAVTELLNQANPALLPQTKQREPLSHSSFVDAGTSVSLTNKLAVLELALTPLLAQAKDARDTVATLGSYHVVTLTKQEEKGKRLLTRLKKYTDILGDKKQNLDFTQLQHQYEKDIETVSSLQADITSLIRLAREKRMAQQTESNPKPTSLLTTEPGIKMPSPTTTKDFPRQKPASQAKQKASSGQKPVSRANQQASPGQKRAESHDCAPQETTYYNRCMQMFFSTEWSALQNLPRFAHFLPIRFCIFLMDIHSNTQGTQPLQPICSPYTLTTVRNIYAHYAFFFSQDTHAQLITELGQIKEYFDQYTLPFVEVQQAISSWVTKAYSLGIDGLGADMDKQVTPTASTRAKLHELYAKAPPEKRAARIQMLLSTIKEEVTAAPPLSKPAQDSITMRLCALELGEHLKADRTHHALEIETASTDEISHAQTVSPHDMPKAEPYEPLLPDYDHTFTQLFTWLIESRHYFFHCFFTGRDQTVATLQRQALSAKDNLVPERSALSVIPYTTLNSFFLAPSRVKDLVLLHEKHCSDTEAYPAESHRYNSTEVEQETGSAGKPSLSL